MSEQEWLEIFADNLIYLLEYTNTSRQELAEMTGITEATISRYINKKQLPGIKAIINIAEALDQDYEEFIFFGDTIY